MPIRVEEILKNRSVGRMQSVGHMQVIPILGEDDDSWAPPDVEAGTSSYGNVNVRNNQDRRTVVPPGSGFVTRQAAQDHAIGDGALVPAGKAKSIDHARCIQETQGGLIREEKGIMVILPAELRSKALQLGNHHSYSALWEPIRKFNEKFGIRRDGHVNYFLDEFGKELDEFVAEFEIIPNQIGAIVLIGGKVIGLEVTPNVEYWRHVWKPLIRVCYGSMALLARRKLGDSIPATRPSLKFSGSSIEDLEIALKAASSEEDAVVASVVTSIAHRQLPAAEGRGERLGKASLTTVSSRELIGQVVTESNEVKYASLSPARA